MIERYARLPIDSPRQIILFVALITILLSPFILQVQFETDVQAFLPQSDEVEAYDEINEDFGRDSSIVQLYLTSEVEGNVLSIDNLMDILVLHNDCDKISGVKDVLSVAGFFDSALIDSDLSLNEVSQRESPWQLVYESISSSGAGNYSWNEVDFVTDVLVNKDFNPDPLLIIEGDSIRSAPIASSTIIMIYLDPDLNTIDKKVIGQKIRVLADEHNSNSGSEIQADAFSVDLLAYDVDKSTQQTNILMALGMLVVTTILLWLSFRDWSYVLFPILTLILSVFWTFSFAGMLGIQLTALAVAVIPLVVGLGIDFAVHISRRYQEGLKVGNSVADSLMDAQLHTGQALTLAMFTTVIAFLSGISAGVGPVRDFSLLCAIGIFTSFVLTLLFYTSLRYLLDSNSEDNLTEVKGSELVDSSISRAAEVVDQYPSAIISAVIILTLVAAFYGSNVDTSFGLEDFLSDDLEIMVTADSIQEEFRGARYSQSQILIEGPIATTDFLNGSYEVQFGEQGTDNDGLNGDRYSIKVGSEARVESVYEVVHEAVYSQEYNVGQGNDATHQWVKTNIFRVSSGETLLIGWNIDNSLSSSTLDGEIFWYDQNNGEPISSQKIICNSLNPNLSLCSKASVSVPPEAHKSRIKFEHVKIQEGLTDSLVSGISVKNEKEYVYVQSLTGTFNLTYKAKPYSLTKDSDIRNLYDYLYQRDLDISDPFTGETYSDRIKHVLYRDMNGDYTSSVIRVYLGPSMNYDLDNEGLEFMRKELSENIPSIFSINNQEDQYEISITGGHVLTSVTVNEIQSTQISSTLLSVVLAAIVLTVVYRNLELGIIATLPTILATIWILATMWQVGITLNVLTVMVTALTVGLGIDYAIHIVERYREERVHKSERQAIESTIKLTGSAILISGLTTVCGFAVLFLSPMPLVRNFGIITAATIVYSIIIAIFVLPSMIWLSNRIKEWYSSQISS
ncbi:MAG TPA: efflux RND transporter permease subunit [Candidatus Poseidoniia archaeon]|nr:efflux RND transporter permease subunit [Candidatus Poseidoniia archaeon]